MTPLRTPLPRLVAACVLALVLAGCTTGDGGSRGLFQQLGKAEITERELDVRVRQLSYRIEFLIQETGGDLYINAANARARAAAAKFALRTTAEISRASYQGDPLATLIDTWALCRQLEAWFERQGSEGVFGPRRDGIVAVFAGLAEECRMVASEIQGPEAAQTFDEMVSTWADANPISEDFARPSVAPLLATTGVVRSLGLGDISQTVGVGLSHLGDQIQTMQTQLPRTLIWQAALLLEARLATIDVSLDQAVAEIGASIEPVVAAQMDRVLAAVREEIAVVMESVTAERIAIMEGVTAERVAIMADVTAERIAIMDGVTRERQAVMDGVSEERTAIMDGVDAERIALMAGIDEQRIATIEDVRNMVDRMLAVVDAQRGLIVDDVDGIVAEAVDQSVDRVFWMMVKLGVGVFAGLLVLIVVVRVLWR